MRYALLSFTALILLSALPPAAIAQKTVNPSDGKAGEVTAEPLCTYLTNRSDQTILGSISTMAQTTADGGNVSQRQNYRLKAGERIQICAQGPFYEGRRLELVIRTLLPLFNCKTKIDQEIFLDSTPQAGGMRKLSATCR